MTPRQRLLAALQCRQPDRVPVDVFINPLAETWVTSDPSYAPVVAHVLERADFFYNYPFNTARFFSAADVPPSSSAVGEHPDDVTTEHRIQAPAGTLTCITKRTFSKVGDWVVKHWVESEADVEAVLSLPYEPVAVDPSGFFAQAQRVGERCLLQVNLPDAICQVAGMVDPNVFALWCHEKLDMVTQMMHWAHRRIKAFVESLVAAAVGPLYYFNGPEYAIPPLLGPRFFDLLVTPWDSELVEIIRRAGNLVVIHSHGKVSRFLEKFADMGISGLNVLEPPPSGDVDLADAKSRIGDRVCLIGNIEYDDVHRLTPEEIRAKVRDAIVAAAPGGGYIVSTTASPYFTPLWPQAQRNYIALVDAVHEFGECAQGTGDRRGGP